MKRKRKEAGGEWAAAALTPAEAQEALADDAVAQTTSDSHVGLPSFRQHPAERGEEEEVQEGGHQSAHHLSRRSREEKSVSAVLLLLKFPEAG